MSKKILKDKDGTPITGKGSGAGNHLKDKGQQKKNFSKGFLDNQFKKGNPGKNKGSIHKTTIAKWMKEAIKDGETMSAAEAQFYIRDKAINAEQWGTAEKANSTIIKYVEASEDAKLGKEEDLDKLSKEELMDKLAALLDKQEDDEDNP